MAGREKPVFLLCPYWAASHQREGLLQGFNHHQMAPFSVNSYRLGRPSVVPSSSALETPFPPFVPLSSRGGGQLSATTHLRVASL